MTAAVCAGHVDRAHVRVLADAHRHYPRLAEALRRIEPEVTAYAASVDPVTFAGFLGERLHGIDPDAVDDADAARLRRDAFLTATTLPDGYVRVTGLLPPDIGTGFRAALDAATRTTTDTRPDDPDPDLPTTRDDGDDPDAADPAAGSPAADVANAVTPAPDLRPDPAPGGQPPHPGGRPTRQHRPGGRFRPDARRARRVRPGRGHDPADGHPAGSATSPPWPASSPPPQPPPAPTASPTSAAPDPSSTSPSPPTPSPPSGIGSNTFTALHGGHPGGGCGVAGHGAARDAALPERAAAGSCTTTPPPSSPVGPPGAWPATPISAASSSTPPAPSSTSVVRPAPSPPDYASWSPPATSTAASQAAGNPSTTSTTSSPGPTADRPTPTTH